MKVVKGFSIPLGVLMGKDGDVRISDACIKIKSNFLINS